MPINISIDVNFVEAAFVLEIMITATDMNLDDIDGGSMASTLMFVGLASPGIAIVGSIVIGRTNDNSGTDGKLDWACSLEACGWERCCCAIAGTSTMVMEPPIPREEAVSPELQLQMPLWYQVRSTISCFRMRPMSRCLILQDPLWPVSYS